LNKNTKTWQRALFALGVSLCLAGAFLMVNGSLFGDRTSGIAIVTGIIGIGLISTHRKVGTDKLQVAEQNRGIQSHAEVTA
jgi:hypothetical protein